MSWNHQIVKYANGDGYGLHEVYYDKDKKPYAMTENAVSFAGDSADEIKEMLKGTLQNIETLGVLDEATEFPK